MNDNIVREVINSNNTRPYSCLSEPNNVKNLIAKYEKLVRRNTINGFDNITKPNVNLKHLKNKEKKFTKKQEYVINELIETERKYIEQLQSGLETYSKIFHEDDLPKPLEGKKDILFRCLKNVLDYHDKAFYVILKDNSYNIQQLLHVISEEICDNKFYCYVTHAFAKRISLDLISSYEDYFATYSCKIGEPFGIESLILSPLRRILKYHLIFENLLKALEENEELDLKLLKLCKTVIKQFKKINDTINAAEEMNKINNFIFIASYDYGKFLKANNFKITDTLSKKSCKCRVFLFEKCLICTQILLDGSLKYWKYFSYDKIGISTDISKGFKIFYNLCDQNALLLIAEDDETEDEWIAKILGMINCFVAEEKDRLYTLAHSK